MLQTLMPLIVLLSWLALPVTLVCIVDDWLLRPRRVIASGLQSGRDAPLMRALYGALPVLIACAVLRLLLAERLDFSAVLLAITVLAGVVWALGGGRSRCGRAWCGPWTRSCWLRGAPPPRARPAGTRC